MRETISLVDITLVDSSKNEMFLPLANELTGNHLKINKERMSGHIWFLTNEMMDSSASYTNSSLM